MTVKAQSFSPKLSSTKTHRVSLRNFITNMSRLSIIFICIIWYLSDGILNNVTNNEQQDKVCESASYSTELQRGHEEMLETAEYNVITKTIILNHGSSDEARKNIKQYFQDTFDLDSSLFHHIKTEVISYTKPKTYFLFILSLIVMLNPTVWTK